MDNGDIALHNGEFVPLFYRVNNDRYEDVAKVWDIRESEKRAGRLLGAPTGSPYTNPK